MTTPADSGRRFPLLPVVRQGPHGTRSHMTCRYRCGDACSRPVPNTGDNTYFGDVAAQALSRRGLLRAGTIGAAVVGAGVSLGLPPAPARAAGPGDAPTGGLSFRPVPAGTRDAVVVPDDYAHTVVLRWGDPILPGAPEFDFDRQTARAQERQFGYNCDYVMLLPLDHARGRRALLWVNHEYTDEELMFRGYSGGGTATPEQLRIAMAAHGGSVVEVERVGHSGRWRPVAAGRRRFNRRITANTAVRLTGPAAGHAALRTAADPAGREVRGMLGNCSGGRTPWGTILTCEENVDQYFVGADGVPADLRGSYARYGYRTTQRYPDDNRRWDRLQKRFDLTRHPNEGHRFGWVVEIDPHDPSFTPRKRTALGRFKHEAATTALTRDHRVAVYLGDDEKFDYIYKFVSHDRVGRSRRRNLDLLDHGTLYVARFHGDSPKSEIDGTGKLPEDGEFDGHGEWIPLVSGDTSHVSGMSAADVLIFTRLAADTVGATKMDRPEDIERDPATGAVYVALTNNDQRTAAQADEANPRAKNKAGHVLEIVEHRDDAGASRFGWRIPLVCGNPDDADTYFGGYDKSKVSPISCPDNLAFDPAGNLWIATDGNPDVLGGNDGLFAMPVRGAERGHVKRFLSVPVAAETCGPLVSADGRTVFVAVQHPGEADGATPDRPASTWPDGDQPRPSVICVWHEHNHRIGA